MGFPTPINEGANIQKFLNQPTEIINLVYSEKIVKK
jgi:hypothetical protein